jgi:hypothetical protein
MLPSRDLHPLPLKQKSTQKAARFARCFLGFRGSAATQQKSWVYFIHLHTAIFAD